MGLKNRCRPYQGNIWIQSILKTVDIMLLPSLIQRTMSKWDCTNSRERYWYLEFVSPRTGRVKGVSLDCGNWEDSDKLLQYTISTL